MVDRSFARKLGTVFLNLLVAIVGVLTAAPLVWMFSASFKPLNEIYKYPPTLFPEEIRFDNYTRLFTEWPFLRWYGNSLFVAIVLTIAVLFFTSLAGYAFAKYRFKGSNALFVILLGSTMIPFQVTLVPLFILNSRLGWTNSYLALIVPFMAPALGIFLMRQFIFSLPTELIEAARIDGASEFGIYWRIILPLSRPALAAQAILTFLGSWNSFIWPLAVLHTQKILTLPVALAAVVGNVTSGREPPVGASMAAATLVTIPVILVFVALQKHYIAGLTAGSVKQ